MTNIFKNRVAELNINRVSRDVPFQPSRDIPTHRLVYSQTHQSYVIPFAGKWYIIPVFGTASLNGFYSLYEAMRAQVTFDADIRLTREQNDIDTIVNMHDCQVFPVVR